MVTHGYRAVIHWWGWTHMTPTQLVPRVLGGALLLVGLNHVLLVFLQRDVLGFHTFEAIDSMRALTISSLHDGFFVYLVWSLLYFIIIYFRNYRQAEIDRLEMEVQSREAKLEAMRLQLNPHFLFNSLNSTRMLVGEDPEQARHMITQLARLLRTTLERSQSVTVTLHEELELTRTYLNLEAMRFEERLTYQFDIDPDAKSVAVPPMIVQTLVENAVKHGIAARKDGGTVTVRANTVQIQKHGDALCVQVTNTGHLNEDASRRGIGLRNLRERLRLLYGDAFTFSIANGESDTNTLSDTVVATVRMPSTLPKRSSAP